MIWPEVSWLNFESAMKSIGLEVTSNAFRPIKDGPLQSRSGIMPLPIDTYLQRDGMSVPSARRYAKKVLAHFKVNIKMFKLAEAETSQIQDLQLMLVAEGPWKAK